MDHADLGIDILGRVPNNFARRIAKYNTAITYKDGFLFKDVDDDMFGNAGNFEGEPAFYQPGQVGHRFNKRIKEEKNVKFGLSQFVCCSPRETLPKNSAIKNPEADSPVMQFLHESLKVASNMAMDYVSQNASKITSSLNPMVNEAKADLKKAGNKKLQTIARKWHNSMQDVDDWINSSLEWAASKTIKSDWYSKLKNFNKDDSLPAVKQLVGGEDWWYNEKLKNRLASGDASALEEYTAKIDKILAELKHKSANALRTEPDGTFDSREKDKARMVEPNGNKEAISMLTADNTRKEETDVTLKEKLTGEQSVTRNPTPSETYGTNEEQRNPKKTEKHGSLSESREQKTTETYGTSEDASKVVARVEAFKKALEAGLAKTFATYVNDKIKELSTKVSSISSSNAVRDAFVEGYTYLTDPLENIVNAKYEEAKDFKILTEEELKKTLEEASVKIPEFEALSTVEDSGTLNRETLDNKKISPNDSGTLNVGELEDTSKAPVSDTGTLNTASLEDPKKMGANETVISKQPIDWKSKLELSNEIALAESDRAKTVTVLTVDEKGVKKFVDTTAGEVYDEEKKSIAIANILRYLVDSEEDDGLRTKEVAANEVATLERKKQVEEEAVLTLMQTERDRISDISLMFLEKAYMADEMDDDGIISLMDANEVRFDVLNKASNLFAQTTLGQNVLGKITEFTSTSLLSDAYYKGVSYLTGKLWGKDSAESLEPYSLMFGDQIGKIVRDTDGSGTMDLGSVMADSAAKLATKGFSALASAVSGSTGQERDPVYRWFGNGELAKYKLNRTMFIDVGHYLGLILQGEISSPEEESKIANGGLSFFETMNKDDDRFKDTKTNNVNTNSEYGISDLATNFRVNKTFIGGEIEYFKTGYYHFFFVKPDLNLTENHLHVMDCSGYPRMCDVIPELSYDLKGLRETWGEDMFPPDLSDIDRSMAHPFFSYLLSNAIKSLSIPDYALESKEGFENMFGHRFSFGTTGRKSGYQTDFSISFYDTSDLLIMNIMKTWTKYIEIMYEGQANLKCTPFQEGNLDYLGALYYFVLEPDNQTIVHWGRYTGIYPVNVPWSSISMSPGSVDMPEFSVNFKCQWHEWNNIAVLQDFNYVMRGAGYYGCPISEKTGSNGEVVNSAEQYFSLASITESTAPSLYADPNMIGGGIISENRALVQYVNLKDVNSNYKASTTLLRPFKYVLTFDSARDFATFNKTGEETPIENNTYETFVPGSKQTFGDGGISLYGIGDISKGKVDVGNISILKNSGNDEQRQAVAEANEGVVTNYGESNGYGGTNYNINF